jgi:hypothetical protein
MSGDYRGAPSGVPFFEYRLFGGNYEMQTTTSSKLRARCVHCNDAIGKPYNSAFKSSRQRRFFWEF